MKSLLDPGEEAGANSGGISGPDGGAGAGAIEDAGAGPAVGAAADTGSPCGSPVGTVAIQNVLMVPGPERKGDPGPGVAEIPVLVPGQQLRLYVVPAPPSDQSFVPDIHLGPHLGPGMFLGHFHIHRLESIIHSLQEVSLPFPGVPVLVLGRETAALVAGSETPQFGQHLLPATAAYTLQEMMTKRKDPGIGPHLAQLRPL